MYTRDSLLFLVYNTLFRRRLPSAVTSFWTDRTAKEHRPDTGTTILKRAYTISFWYTQVYGSWLPHALVIGEDCRCMSAHGHLIRPRLTAVIRTCLYRLLYWAGLRYCYWSACIQLKISGMKIWSETKQIKPAESACKETQSFIINIHSCTKGLTTCKKLTP
jgi:hypothetical protein